jgi:hypothetical protein
MHSVFSKDCIIFCTNYSVRYHYKKLLYGPQITTRKRFIILKQEVCNHILFDICIIIYSHNDSTFTTWWHNPCYATKRQWKLWPTMCPKFFLWRICPKQAHSASLLKVLDRTQLRVVTYSHPSWPLQMEWSARQRSRQLHKTQQTQDTGF